MMEKVALSIIMPAYNAQNYIEKGIKSVIEQEYNDYEFIIVNDGSKDKTLEIVETYAKIFPQIRVINTENSGPSHARNLGIKKACGSYLLFMDSDDTIEPGTISTIMEVVEKNKPDLLIFGYNIIDSNNQYNYSYRYENKTISTGSDLAQEFPDLYINNMLNQVWNKLYSAKMLKDNNIEFLNYKYGEDRLFVFETLKYCRKITIVDNCLYNYYMNDSESLINKFYDKKFEVCCLIDDKLRELVAFLSGEKSDDKETFSYMFLKSVLSCFTNLFSKHCPYNMKEKRAAIKTMLRNPKVIQNSKVKIQNSFYFTIIRLIMRSGNITINYIMAWSIAKISKRLPKLFIRAKHNVNTKDGFLRGTTQKEISI